METFISTLGILCGLDLDAALELIRSIHLRLTAAGVGDLRRPDEKKKSSERLVERMQYFAVMPEEEREDLFEEVMGMLLAATIAAKQRNPSPTTSRSHGDGGSRFNWGRATKAFGFITRCLLHDFDDTERAEARTHFERVLARISGAPTLGNDPLAFEIQQMQEGFEDRGEVEMACKVSSKLCEVLNLTEMTDAAKRAQKRLARAEQERTQRAVKAASGKASNADLLAQLAALGEAKPPQAEPKRSKDRGSSRGTVPLVDDDAAAQLEALRRQLAERDAEVARLKAAEPAPEPPAPVVEDEEEDKEEAPPAAPPVQPTDKDGNWVDSAGRPVRMESKGESGKDYGKRLRAWQRKLAKA